MGIINIEEIRNGEKLVLALELEAWSEAVVEAEAASQ